MYEWGFERDNQLNEFENESGNSNIDSNESESETEKEGMFSGWKGSLIIAGIILVVAIIFSIMKVQYIETLNLWWLIFYTIGDNFFDSLFITIIAGIIMVFLFKIDKKFGIISLLFFVLVFCLLTPRFIEEYEIKGDEQNCGEFLINAFKDAVFDEYEIIHPTKIDVLEKTYINKSRRGRSRETKHYYLVIDDGRYVIPIITNNEKLLDSIHNAENLEIKVHKNTNLLYEINGVKVNKLTKDAVNRINSYYGGKGCELYICGNSVGVKSDDDASCESYNVGIFMPNGNMFTMMPYDTTRLYPLIAVEDGKWTVLLTDGNKVCSNNIIEYDVVDGDIVDVRSVKK